MVKPMYCERCVFNSGQHSKECVAPKGGLFNPKSNLYEEFWKPGGVRDRVAAQMAAAQRKGTEAE